MSNEIFLTLKQTFIWRQMFRELKLNQLFQTYNVSNFVQICLIMFFLKRF